MTEAQHDFSKLQPLAAGATGAEARSRPLFTYPIPKSLHKYGVRSIGLVELTLEEEAAASRRAGNDALKLGLELASTSLRQVNGQDVSVVDGTADGAVAKMGSKVRQLLVMAYQKLHMPEKDEIEGFLKGEEVTVG